MEFLKCNLDLKSCGHPCKRNVYKLPVKNLRGVPKLYSWSRKLKPGWTWRQWRVCSECLIGQIQWQPFWISYTFAMIGVTLSSILWWNSNSIAPKQMQYRQEGLSQLNDRCFADGLSCTLLGLVCATNGERERLPRRIVMSAGGDNTSERLSLPLLHYLLSRGSLSHMTF